MFDKFRAKKAAQKMAAQERRDRIAHLLDEAERTGQPVKVCEYRITTTVCVIVEARPDGSIGARGWAQAMPGMPYECYDLEEVPPGPPIEPPLD